MDLLGDWLLDLDTERLGDLLTECDGLIDADGLLDLEERPTLQDRAKLATIAIPGTLGLGLVLRDTLGLLLEEGDRLVEREALVLGDFENEPDGDLLLLELELGLGDEDSAQSSTSVPTSLLPSIVATTSAVRYAMLHP